MKITNVSAAFLLTLGLAACAAKTVEHVETPNTPVAKEVTSIEPVAATPAAVHHDKTPGVPADKALGWLKNGNTRFLSSKLRKDGQSQRDIATLAKGQHPHTIILSCSDSRVPPELLFDQKLGEIFVIRTAGEDLDQAGIASIEYAVEHLGPQLIVVMGHTSCGAVKAALDTGDKDAGSPALNTLVHDIQPRVTQYMNRKPSSLYQDESWSNATGVSKELAEKSAIIKKRVESGALKIVTALYHTENGKVDFNP